MTKKGGFVTYVELKPRAALTAIGKQEPTPKRKDRATKPKRRKRKKNH